MRVTTRRLLLRDFDERDLDRAPPTPPRPSSVPVQPFDWRDVAGVKRQVREALSSAREDPRVTWDLAMVVTATDELIGRAGLRRNEREPKEAQVWFASDPAWWNQGFANETLTALLGVCFDQLRLHRITAECSPANAGAVALFEGLGLRREAHFVENVQQGSAWVDTAVFAMLDREWAARPR
ncbi:MAG: GNAT family N-acetyltransferase [Myxococcaceae bacterium]|nr:GNAT family N-acetyltransferase [Myxococcaceae bacterium]